MFYFREPLLKLMKRQKLDQVELSRESGVSQGVITKLMKWQGCESVNLVSIGKLCKTLETPAWSLIKKATREAESHD